MDSITGSLRGRRAEGEGKRTRENLDGPLLGLGVLELLLHELKCCLGPLDLKGAESEVIRAI